MSEITTEKLDAFLEAMNRGDIEAVVDAMTDDCIFESYLGPDPCGTRYAGRGHVRAALLKRWRSTPDAKLHSARHLIFGDRGVSEWVLALTREVSSIEVNGCYVFTFRDGKIAMTSEFRKVRRRPGWRERSGRLRSAAR